MRLGWVASRALGEADRCGDLPYDRIPILSMCRRQVRRPIVRCRGRLIVGTILPFTASVCRVPNRLILITGAFLMAGFPGVRASFLCLALSAIASSVAAAEWKLIAPEGADLTCEMPGEPKASNQTVETAVGPIEVILHILEVPEGAYLVNSTTIPPNAPAATIEERLNGARDGAVKNSQGKLLTETKIKLGVNQGRELLIEQGSGLFVRARVFMAGKRLVQVVAVTKTKEPTPDVTRFLDSLKLVKK